MAGTEEQVHGAQAPAAGDAADEFAVRDPATGEVIAHCPDLGPEAVAAMARRGREVQPAWEALGFAGRGRILRRMQKWVIDHREEIIAVIRSETGKTYEDALIAEISYGAAAFGFWAANAEGYLADEKVRSSAVLVKGKKLLVRYRPLGLIGVIGPWNYPFTNSFGDCIPALAAGNSVILKPSEVTPLTSLKLAEGLRECGVPDGVFQVATGQGPTGAALVEQVDMIMFTGSTATGKKIMAEAAKTLTPVSLELGGKDPMIVLADADVDRAANTALYYGMFNGGQTCISVERVYVEEPIYDAFVAKVTEKARKLRQGAGGPGTADVGAMTFPPQVDIVERHVQDARDKGARVLVGGSRGDHAAGSWYEPTILVDVDHTMTCMTEETFGPTLPIMKVRDEEEAIRLANDSPYGLAASVFGKDVKHAEAVARRVEAGAVCVNDALVNYSALELPMGGAKASGLGSRHGAGGIRKYTQQQAILVTRFAMRKDPHMYPYSARMTKRLGRLFAFLYGRGARD
ncbi:aldehyde dehydrogenase family protein [Baekduia soli]|uniref:Aldehyde dehydrogenase n=1 Tax=Baekduia soli TaxID=496014 RepID=A0A5B8U2H3_9ACTN|nr:aldehyde dehydrogenase family protein [Baekduia soli]QEC47168.1 aldehyde dehydrogenase family protein [Baekduia soli]